MAWRKTLWLPLVESSWIYKFPYYCSIHALYLCTRRQVLSSSARCRYFAIAERLPRFLNREHVKLLNWPKSITCACFVALALAGCIPLSLGTIDLGWHVNVKVHNNLPIRAGACEVSFLDIEVN
jgi:hypothetical protein